jgi:H+/Cl- antiporter ClcA
MRRGRKITAMGRPLRMAIGAAVCGLAAGLLSLLIELAILAVRTQAESANSAGLGAVSAPLYAPYIAVAGCIAGAVWQWKRSRRTRGSVVSN